MSTGFQEIIIPYNSKTFNKDFFKKKEKKDLILIIHKNYLKYTLSPFEYVLTSKINASKRLILYRKNVSNILKNLFNIQKNYMGDGLIEIILKYIGLSVNDIYINLNMKITNSSICN
tara:strand:- start:1425 stop:1775 length:351 start_codon:yes stop_codon:yes gene_type:complete